VFEDAFESEYKKDLRGEEKKAAKEGDEARSTLAISSAMQTA